MFVRSITMSMPSGIAIIGLVIMSKIMGGTGQTSVLRGCSKGQQDLRHIGSGGNGGIVHDRKQYVIQYTLWRVSGNHSQSASSEPGANPGPRQRRFYRKRHQPQQYHPGDYHSGNPGKRGTGAKENHTLHDHYDAGNWYYRIFISGCLMTRRQCRGERILMETEKFFKTKGQGLQWPLQPSWRPLP